MLNNSSHLQIGLQNPDLGELDTGSVSSEEEKETEWETGGSGADLTEQAGPG